MLALLTSIAVLLVIYHHLAWPWLLRRIARSRRARPMAQRPAQHDPVLPAVTVVIPAYNESDHVADKVRNLAALDYPRDRLRVIVACDGCGDDTAAQARAAHAEPACSGLRLEVREFAENRGKVAVLNEVLADCDGELVALSDVSALVSRDALRIAAGHFADPEVGVVAGGYRLLSPGGAGENAYWHYQIAVKRDEAALGAPIGVHGAFYMLRRALFTPLPADTINDDFVLPMRIAADGHRIVYDLHIEALELECADRGTDRRRRARIAAGNLQQVWRMRRLLHPSHGAIALAFASGKALRAVMPLLLAFALGGSLWLAGNSLLFLVLALGQLALYSAALLRNLIPRLPVPGAFDALHYLVFGHVAGLVGAVRYLAGLERGRWTRAVRPQEN